MVGPERRDFWPRIDILLKEKSGKKIKKILAMNVNSSKIGHDFSDKVVQKLTLEKNVFKKKMVS